MRPDRAHAVRQRDRTRRHLAGQPAVPRCSALAVPHGIVLARSSGAFRQLERRFQAPPPPGTLGRVFIFSDEFGLEKAFDAGRLLGVIEERGAEAVNSSRRNRRVPRDHVRAMYKWRQQVENLFARIKFRAVATRYYRTDESFVAAVLLVAGVAVAT